MSKVRSLCQKALVRWETNRPFADELLHETLERGQLPPRDRAFLTELFYGCIRNLTLLDLTLDRLSHGALDLPTRCLLRLGLYQLLFTRVPAHATVHETVDLAGRASGLVNAVLRRALREREPLDQWVASLPPAARLSHPDFLVERWTATFGVETTTKLLTWNNTAASPTFRLNTLRMSAAEFLSRHGATWRNHPAHPLVFECSDFDESLFEDGLVYAQDPSTLMACDLLAPKPGETILDACAAPGGKTSYLAALMENRGQIVACDLWESRVERLRENLQRLGVRNTQTLVVDMMKELPAVLEPGGFDRILLDAPCSNTGVMRRRLDVRWRLTDEDFLRMPFQQFALARRIAPLLKQGGTLVYSTCSLEPEENEGVARQIATEIPGLSCVEIRNRTPWEFGTDGAFAARFVKTGG
jgi:16S rRNA (cytosine967-C5)-methyltransferase